MKYPGRVAGDDPFFFFMAASFLLFGSAGWYLHTHRPQTVTIEEEIKRIRQTHFVIEEEPKHKIIPKKNTIEKKGDAVKEKPVDLTKKPILDQKKEEIVETLSSPEQVKQPPRRVYGLKKVYSVGIGAAGSLEDAIIGKQGNTLDTDIDTITATETDLKSAPVPITTVTSPPRIKLQVKPEYSKEMLQNRVEGVIRVKMLIDIDGKVKQVIVLDDLGFGSKEKVAEACFKMLFEPAKRGDQPVSVWISFKFRFEMLEG